MKLNITRDGQDNLHMFSQKDGKYFLIEKHENSFFIDERGPALLDVSITNHCARQCEFCYKKSSDKGQHLSFDDYKIVIENAIQCGVKQIAIGGGEPTSHPDFVKILKYTRESGIVPNYSTNGDNIHSEIIQATRDFCGAVAISVYEDIDNYKEVVDRFKMSGCLVNLHFVLKGSRINTVTKILKNPPEWFYKVDALVFLNFKPSAGEVDECLNSSSKKRVKSLFREIKRFKVCDIAFDTCSVSFINKLLNVEEELYDYCESARRSAYISEDLKVLPCSFYKCEGNSLRTESLKDIWASSVSFREHRDALKEKLLTKCKHSRNCAGGCPIYEVNYCSKC